MSRYANKNNLSLAWGRIKSWVISYVTTILNGRISYIFFDNYSQLPATGDSGKIYMVATFSEVETPTGNPSTNGYYVYENNLYISSTDTSVVSGTTYYTKNAAYDEYNWVGTGYNLIGPAALELGEYAKVEDVPTKTSELTNDSNFIDTSFIIDGTAAFTEHEKTMSGYAINSEFARKNDMTTAQGNITDLQGRMTAVEGKTQFINDTYKFLSDNIYRKQSGTYFPVAHPDLSTQPSVLPQRFGSQPIYEVLIPNVGVRHRKVGMVNNVVTSDMFVGQVTQQAFNNDAGHNYFHEMLSDHTLRIVTTGDATEVVDNTSGESAPIESFTTFVFFSSADNRIFVFLGGLGDGKFYPVSNPSRLICPFGNVLGVPGTNVGYMELDNSGGTTTMVPYTNYFTAIGGSHIEYMQEENQFTWMIGEDVLSGNATREVPVSETGMSESRPLTTRTTNSGIGYIHFAPYTLHDGGAYTIGYDIADDGTLTYESHGSVIVAGDEETKKGFVSDMDRIVPSDSMVLECSVFSRDECYPARTSFINGKLDVRSIGATESFVPDFALVRYTSLGNNYY